MSSEFPFVLLAAVIRFRLDFKATPNEKSHNCCSPEGEGVVVLFITYIAQKMKKRDFIVLTRLSGHEKEVL